MTEQEKQQLEKEVKYFAKNNFCASSYDDIDVYIDVMTDLIESKNCFDSNIFNELLHELEYTGNNIDEEEISYVYELVKKEAKYWLSDYRKHRKEYE